MLPLASIPYRHTPALGAKANRMILWLGAVSHLAFGSQEWDEELKMGEWGMLIAVSSQRQMWELSL